MSTAMTASSGTLLTASPAFSRPRLIDGRSNISVDSAANGSVSMRRKTSIAFSTALSPSHGVEPWAARPRTARRIISTPLAWTPTLRSVGSPVIANRRAGRGDTRSSVAWLVEVLGLLVGRAHEAHPRALEVAQVAQRAHDRGQAALHVVGAAADQPLALDARLELLREAGHDVDVPVQDDHAGRRPSPTWRAQHRQAVVLLGGHVEPVGVHPALDEARRRADALRRGGVVA